MEKTAKESDARWLAEAGARMKTSGDFNAAVKKQGPAQAQEADKAAEAWIGGRDESASSQTSCLAAPGTPGANLMESILE